MSETTRPAARGVVPWGLAGMLALVLVAERAVSRHEPIFTGDTMVLAWRASRPMVRDQAARAEVLCVGDSLVKLGVQPRVLEARLGLPSYNLAVGGASAPATFFLLRRALEAGARPAALIIDFDAEVLQTPPRMHQRYWPELIDSREAIDLCWSARDSDLLGATGLALLLPSVKHRDEVCEEVRVTLAGASRPTREIRAAYARNWRLNGGATVLGPSPPPPDEPATADPAASRSRRGWAPYPANASYVRRALDLAAAREVLVFWLLPPVSPSRQARRERSGLDEGFSRFVRETAARYPNVVVLDARRSGYARDLFADPTHLHRVGAVELSAAVADALASRLADGVAKGPQWVDLPPFRGRPIDVALEEMEQSRMAVAAPPAPSRR
jgi:hypothetical protein